MTASIDHAASVGQKTAGGHECTAKGLEEQWLKELEQAHMQKQVSAMRSSVVSHDEEVDEAFGGQAPDPADKFAESPAEADFCDGPEDYPNAKYDPNGHGERKASGETDPIGEPARDAVLWSYPGIAEDNMLFRHSTGSIDSSMRAEAPSPLDLPALRRLLPPSSVLTAFDDADGVHLVIRDASLEASDVLRVIEKIQEAITLRKRRLAAVTLNGHCLWKESAARRANSSSGDVVQKQWIDRIF